MNAEQVAEIFIRAAEVDRKLPNTAKPAMLKAVNHGYIHDTADMNGWFAEDKHAANWEWLDPKHLRNSTNDMGIWSVSMELVKLIPDPKKRRAVWAWATAKAGGLPFSRWCREVEGIQTMTGDWRRRDGIKCISLAFARKALQNNGNDSFGDFTNQPEISDKHVIISDPTHSLTWQSDDAFSPVAVPELRDFTWADKRNEMRRQREARKREAA